MCIVHDPFHLLRPHFVFFANIQALGSVNCSHSSSFYCEQHRTEYSIIRARATSTLLSIFSLSILFSSIFHLSFFETTASTTNSPYIKTIGSSSSSKEELEPGKQFYNHSIDHVLRPATHCRPLTVSAPLLRLLSGTRFRVPYAIFILYLNQLKLTTSIQFQRTCLLT